jgi:lipoyl(octanoyl) transferase
LICYAVRLGRVEYPQALALQMRVCELKKQGFAEDVLLLLEHPPTITLGRNGKRNNLLVTEEIMQARGVRLFEVDRGGDITFHGPGQLVGYPLLRLGKGEQDVHRYMRDLEESLIRALGAYGIEAGRNEHYTGVWTAAGKVAAMGVHISRWITRHGFALNVNTDLSFFDLIVPCGISGKGVASMQSILGHPLDADGVAEVVAREFGTVFRRELVWISGDDLQHKLSGYARETATS